MAMGIDRIEVIEYLNMRIVLTQYTFDYSRVSKNIFGKLSFNYASL